MKKIKIAIILPTIREESLKKFLTLWRKEFKALSNKYTLHIYIIEDNPKKSFIINKKYPGKIHHAAWEDIQVRLGKNSWIIPHRTDAIRSFGVLLAYYDKCDYFITLDDDCYPHYTSTNKPGYFIDMHMNNLTNYAHHKPLWTNTIQGLKPRGYPYLDTTIEQRITHGGISHGLWVNVPDFDSITQLSLSKKTHYFEHVKNQIIPNGSFFPMSSMNLAWKREIAPLMYFLLMGQDEQTNKYDYDRFGDIWCGLLAKKIVDHLGYATVSGGPCVNHERASNPLENLQKEASGIKHNEIFWRDIYSMRLTKKEAIGAYKEVIHQLPLYSPYWEKLKRAMTIWISLF